MDDELATLVSPLSPSLLLRYLLASFHHLHLVGHIILTKRTAPLTSYSIVVRLLLRVR